MNDLFTLLTTLAFIALIVGLIKPSWVKMPSRKRVGMIYGGAWLVFFILFGITSGTAGIASTQSQVAATATSSPSAAAAPTTQTPVIPAAVVVAPTSSPSQNIPLTTAQALQATDQLYFGPLNYGNVVIDFQYVGQDLSTAGKDLQGYNYSAAITDMKAVQSDLQRCESDLQFADTLAPFTPDVTKIDTLANDAVSIGLKGASIAITDMENANYDGVNSVATPDFVQMDNDFNKAQQLVAGWKAQQQ